MADATPPPNRIVTPRDRIEPDKTVSQPPSTFESYMQEAGAGNRAAPMNSSAPQGAAGPTELQPSTLQPGTPTLETLLNQTRNTQDRLGTIEQQLQAPNMKLKRSQTHLLKNKLQDSTDHLQAAAGRLGLPPQEPQTAVLSSPVGRLLSYIGHGQDVANSVEERLKTLAKTNKQINPADMLFVQVKLAQATQELDYSTILLGKVMTAITTLMNTQL